MTAHPLVAVSVLVGVSDPRVLALELEGSERVLEIGTGCGWQTALLGRLAAEVWSVERWDDLAEAAWTQIARHGSGGDEEVVVFVKRDGSLQRLSTVAGACFVPLIGRHGFER